MPKPTALLKGFERFVDNPMKHKKAAEALQARKRAVIFDETTTGLALIISPKGKRSFSIVARDPAGKQVWKRIGDPASMTVPEARQEATAAVARVKAGEAPTRAPVLPQKAPQTFKEVAQDFVALWVDMGGKEGNGVPLRNKREIERHLKVYLYPEWESLPFLSIRRGEVARLMDKIHAKNGAPMADRVLATLNKMFNWYRKYDERYDNPIIPELKKSGSIKARARRRFLSDDEIRAVWKACGEIGTYGAMVKVGLLTSARREKVSTMRWDEIVDGVWTLSVVPREKPHAGVLKLPKMALDVIEAQPKIEGNPFVFAGSRGKAFNSHSVGKKALDAKVPTDQWQFHDLRRTARSLMARAGVRSDIAERTLGHVIPGVEGVYDRHSYAKEKGEALEALALLVDRILKGSTGNVVQLGAGR